MKKTLTLALASVFLFACGGGDAEGEGGGSAKGTTFEMTNTHAPLDKFEKKSSTAFKSGMNWNGTKFQPVLYVAVSNMDKIEYNKMWANVKQPENEGEVIIIFQFSGKRFDKGTEPTDLEAGDYGVGGDFMNGDMGCKAQVYMKGSAADLMMQSATRGDDFSGKAKITNLTKDLVEGEIEMTGKDGTKVTVKFSEKIEQDYWESEFKGGKA